MAVSANLRSIMDHRGADSPPPRHLDPRACRRQFVSWLRAEASPPEPDWQAAHLDDLSAAGISRLRSRLSAVINQAEADVKKERRQQFRINRLEGVARAQGRLLTPGSREGQRILHKVPPRTRFTTLVAAQQSHRVPNLLTFLSAEELSTTLATALGVPRLSRNHGRGRRCLTLHTPWRALGLTTSRSDAGDRAGRS